MKMIIFDMDGVLFDTVLVAQQYLQSGYPELTPEVQREMLVGNFFEELEKYKATQGPVQETPEEREVRRLAYVANKSVTKMYDGMHDLVHELHDKGYILVLNTSAKERNCIPLLEEADIASKFDFVATKDLSRSKIEKFKIIEDKYGVSADQVLFITDTLGDIREADLAGVPTVAVSWGAHDHSFFNREYHENLKGIMDSADELRNFIYTHLPI